MAHSGEINFLRYNPFAAQCDPSVQTIHSADPFPQLSCLSVNCTDDFMLASGLLPEFAVYDVLTGKALRRVVDCHTDTINTATFSNTSPHLFCTASFDHTCKLWDLRQPLLKTKAVKSLCTGGRNIMSTFAPDDGHLQCSGVDTQLVQFEVPSWRQSPEKFDLHEPFYHDRFRRSTYMPDCSRLATAATEEAVVHIMSVEDGSIVEAMDFQGMSYLQPFASDAPTRGRSSGVATRDGVMPMQRQGHLDGGVENDGTSADRGTESGGLLSARRRDLSSSVFVQSLRAHPNPSINSLGVLLRPQRGKHSCVAVVETC
jgi:WD40 repeat protein